MRPRNGRLVAGVCAGLARRWGTSAFLVRLLAVLSCILPGPQFIAYVVLWIIIPNGDGPAVASARFRR